MAQREMTRHEARRLVDPVLPIERVQKSGADFFDRRGSILQGFVRVSRQPRRRHVEVPREIDGDGSVKDGARRLDGVRSESRVGTDALQPLMHGVAVGEDVVRRFPIPVFVGQAEPRDTQRGRITKRAAEIVECGSAGNRGLERVDDRTRIVA